MIHLNKVHRYGLEALKELPIRETQIFDDASDYWEDLIGYDDELKADLIETKYLEMDVLIRIHNQFSFASAFASFEHTLSRRAEAMMRNAQSPFVLRDLSDKGLRRARKVMSKVAGLGGLFELEESKSIETYELPRHKIVHAGGLVELGSEDEKKLKKQHAFRMRCYGDGTSFAQIEVSDDLVLAVFWNFKKFLEKLEVNLRGAPKQC